jgi:HK97 family phage portal protein
LSTTTEQFGINFFKNGANAGGILSHPQTLSDEAYERLRKSFEEKYQGMANSNKPMILEEGLDFKRLTISNSDSQFLDTRGYQKAEIAALFKVPLYMLGDMSKTTFNNMEQLSTNFVVNTLVPWATRFEQGVNISILDSENDLYCKFNLNSIMRGDFKTRTEGYKAMIDMGAMTPDEVRAKEELDVRGGAADRLYMQLNMAPLENLDKAEK